MTNIIDRIDDFVDSNELAKWIREHVDKLAKSWDIDSLKKIWDLIKNIFKEKEMKSFNNNGSVWEIISDLFRDKS